MMIYMLNQNSLVEKITLLENAFETIGSSASTPDQII